MPLGISFTAGSPWRFKSIAWNGLCRRGCCTVEVTLIDDIDGGKADETITFGVDGTQYVIDLSKKNAEKLRKTIAPYVEAARKDRGVRQAGRGAQRKASA